MSLLKKILKVIVLLAAALSVPATGLFGQMAFQALTTQNIGAVLVGAIFLAYFLIAASVCLLLLSWISFWNISWVWNLALGLEAGGLLALIIIFLLGISKSADYKSLTIFAILGSVCGILAVRFLRRAHSQYSAIK